MTDIQYRYSMLFQHCHEVEVQRDELLEALEMVRDADDDNGRKIPSLARAKVE